MTQLRGTTRDGYTLRERLRFAWLNRCAVCFFRPLHDAQRAIDDPEWVLGKYHEAKELVEDLRQDDVRLSADLRERVENFWTDTFMDECTTLGFDCACNDRPPNQNLSPKEER